jgi:hypothetical protein
MNYLHQPITGLSLKITQLFSGRVNSLFNNCCGLTRRLQIRSSVHITKILLQAGLDVETIGCKSLSAIVFRRSRVFIAEQMCAG